MSLSRDSIQERKAKAFLRKQFQLEQEFRRIDFEETVLIPMINDMKAGKPILGLEAGQLFDMKIVSDADRDQNT